MMEIWKDISDYKGQYQASNLGRVRSLDRKVKCRCGNLRQIKGVVLKALKNGTSNYPKVMLSKHSKMKGFTIHRLVAKTFIDNPENKPEVNHINGDRYDNRVVNLEWCTRSENELHAHRTNLKCFNGFHGEDHPRSKLTECDVRKIKQLLNNSTLSCSDLGEMFGVSRTAINLIRRGKNWKHVS